LVRSIVNLFFYKKKKKKKKEKKRGVRISREKKGRGEDRVYRKRKE